MGPSSRRDGAFAIAALAGSVAGCTALTGLGELFVKDGCMDCAIDGSASGDGSSAPPSSSDGGLRWKDAADDGPPACDQTSDPSCLALPAGWALVAATDLGGGKAPACPIGFDGSKDAKIDVGESPSPTPDTCSCDTCRVTQAAVCAGPVSDGYGTGCATAAPSSFYANDPPNTCRPLQFLGTYEAEHRFTLSSATGGACAGDPPVLHDNRVSWGKRTRLCVEIARCSGGVCDARLDEPYRACVAHDGDLACPDGFPQRSLTGEKATFDCSGTCGCSVGRSCNGTITHYSDSECAVGGITVAADGVCRSTALGGKAFGSYRVSASPTTNCSATGSGTASNARLASLITLCCR